MAGLESVQRRPHRDPLPDRRARLADQLQRHRPSAAVAALDRVPGRDGATATVTAPGSPALSAAVLVSWGTGQLGALVSCGARAGRPRVPHTDAARTRRRAPAGRPWSAAPRAAYSGGPASPDPAAWRAAPAAQPGRLRRGPACPRRRTRVSTKERPTLISKDWRPIWRRILRDQGDADPGRAARPASGVGEAGGISGTTDGSGGQPRANRTGRGWRDRPRANRTGRG